MQKTWCSVNFKGSSRNRASVSLNEVLGGGVQWDESNNGKWVPISLKGGLEMVNDEFKRTGNRALWFLKDYRENWHLCASCWTTGISDQWVSKLWEFYCKLTCLFTSSDSWASISIINCFLFPQKLARAVECFMHYLPLFHISSICIFFWFSLT